MNISITGLLFIVVLVIVLVIVKRAIIEKRKNKKRKKRFPSLLLILGITLFCYSMTNWSETKRMLGILYNSTPDYLVRYFSHRPEHFLYPAALLFGVLFLCIAHRRIMKWARSTRTDTEAFDRQESYDKEESKSAQHTEDADSFKTLVCPNCGMMLPASSSFCQYCGVKIENIGSSGQSSFSKNDIGIKN